MYTMNTMNKPVRGTWIDGKIMYNTTEVARLLGVTVVTASKYIKEGKLVGERKGNRTYVSAEEVKAWLEYLKWIGKK